MQAEEEEKEHKKKVAAGKVGKKKKPGAHGLGIVGMQVTILGNDEGAASKAIKKSKVDEIEAKKKENERRKNYESSLVQTVSVGPTLFINSHIQNRKRNSSRRKMQLQQISMTRSNKG